MSPPFMGSVEWLATPVCAREEGGNVNVRVVESDWSYWEQKLQQEEETRAILVQTWQRAPCKNGVPQSVQSPPTHQRSSGPGFPVEYLPEVSAGKLGCFAAVSVSHSASRWKLLSCNSAGGRGWDWVGVTLNISLRARCFCLSLLSSIHNSFSGQTSRSEMSDFQCYSWVSVVEVVLHSAQYTACSCFMSLSWYYLTLLRVCGAA